MPFLSGNLLAAVGEARSSAAVASATAVALQRAGGSGAVLGVLAYPPSLPFYLGRPVALATATGAELTSNYIADNVERLRAAPGSPLLPAGYWRERSEEHTSELQSQSNLVCRLLLEKKKMSEL